MTRMETTKHTDDTKEPLPEGWCWIRLGDVCQLVGDSVDPQKFPNEIFAHYSIPAFDNGKRPVLEPGVAILSNKVLFQSNSVLFSKLNPRITRIWEVVDAHNHRRLCSTEFLPLVVCNTEIDLNFLSWVLQEPSLISRLRGRVAAATKSRERLKPEIVLAARFPLPPLAEQRRIARVLREQMAAVEKAREAAQARLEAVKTLPAAYLRQVFPQPGQPLPAGWRWVKLGKILSLRTEILHPRDFPKGPAIFVGLEHIESDSGRRIGSEQVETSELTGRKPRFSKGDLVYGYLRPYLNKVWIAELDGLCSVDQYVYLVDAEMVIPEYVAWFMRSSAYIENSPVGKTPGWLPRIRTEEVASVEIPLPPLTDQRRIAGVLRKRMAAVEKARAAAEEELQTISTLPAALLRRAFNGEV